MRVRCIPLCTVFPVLIGIFSGEESRIETIGTHKKQRENTAVGRSLDLRSCRYLKTYNEAYLIWFATGLTADADILINYARLSAQRYELTYQQKQPCEQLVQSICTYKQAYTQFGGQRPFGVSFLYAGWDRHHGLQLYHSDPSGNYGGWKATAIGANNRAAKSLLKNEYKEGCSIEEALLLAIKVMGKTMDISVPSVDKVELTVLSQDESGKITQRRLSKEETEKLVKDAELTNAQADDM